MPSVAAIPSLIDDADFLSEIDKLQRTRSAKPEPPVRIEKRVRTEAPSSPRVGNPGPDRIETPFRPEGPARHDKPERPVPPAHVDEIGQ
jgi:hypothetical protein